MTKKLVIADPSFEDWVGHHAPYDVSILKEGRSEGLTVSVWAANTLKSEFSGYSNHIENVYSTSAWGKNFEKKKGRVTTKITLGIFVLFLLPYRLLKIMAAWLLPRIHLLAEVLRLIIPPLVYDGMKDPIKYIKFFTPPIINDILRKIIPPFIFGLFTHTRWWIKSLTPPILHDLLRVTLTHKFELIPKFFYIFLLNNSKVQYRETLKQIKKTQLKSGDILLCHMVTGYNFLAWALIVHFCQKRGINAKILFRYPVDFIPSSRVDVRLGRRIYEECAKTGAVEYYTDSVFLSEKYRKFLNAPLQTLPIPHLPDFITIDKPVLSSKVVVAVLGNARSEKGFCEIVESLQILESRGRFNFEFHIQINNPDQTAAEFIPKLQTINRITVIQYPVALNENEYKTVLERADVVLAPYHAEIYGARTSGVLVEAISAGKIAIVTRNSWLSNELEQYGTGFAVRNKSPENIADALVMTQERFHALRSDAIGKSHEYRKIHGPKHFLNCLYGKSKFGYKNLPHVVIVFPFPDFFEQKSGATYRTGLLCEFLVSKGINVSVVLPNQTIQFIPKRLEGVTFHQYRKIVGLTNYYGFLKSRISLLTGDYRHLWYINSVDENINNIYFYRALNDSLRPNSVIFVDYPFDSMSVKKATRAYGNKICLTLFDLMGNFGENESLKLKALKFELCAANLSDKVVTVAKHESDFLESLGIRNVLIPNPCVISYGSKVFRDKKPTSLEVNGDFILFVGSSHAPNIKAANKLKEIARELKDSGSKITVVVAGACHAPVKEGNFFALGKIDDKTLRYLHRNCLLVVCPLEDGSGASLKTIEAMSYEKIVLGTPDAFRGLAVTHYEHCIIEKKISNYHNRIIEIQSNFYKYKPIEVSAFRFSQFYDYRKVYEEYYNFINIVSNSTHSMVNTDHPQDH